MMGKHHHPKPTAIRFEQVSVQFQQRQGWKKISTTAIDQLTFTIDCQSLGIIGPSGAGKSTLIELLLGLKLPSSGDVFICEQKVTQLNAQARSQLAQHIQLIPQEPQATLNPYYTVEQILAEPLINLGQTADLQQNILNSLQQVGLSAQLLQLNSQALSVGQAQRVAIARALIVSPCTLIADEPTSSLDPVSRQQIIDLLLKIQREQQMQLILVTHDLQAAQQLCGQLLVLDQGKIVEQGDIMSIMQQPQHSITQALLHAQLGVAMPASF